MLSFWACAGFAVVAAGAAGVAVVALSFWSCGASVCAAVAAVAGGAAAVTTERSTAARQKRH